MSDLQRTSQSIAGRGMSGGMILLFAVAVGQAVASNYLAQPLLETIRDVFGVSEAVAGLIVTASQVGYPGVPRRMITREIGRPRAAVATARSAT